MGFRRASQLQVCDAVDANPHLTVASIEIPTSAISSNPNHDPARNPHPDPDPSQVWDGRRWSQEDMPGSRRATPPSGRPRGAAPSAPTANGATSAAQSNGASAVSSGNGASHATGPGSNGSTAGNAASASQRASADAHSPAAVSGGSARKPWEAAQSAPRPVADTSAGATAAAATATASATASAASSGSTPAEEKAKAEVPAMVAQPLLEAHYSLHGAFLERPLLEVCVVTRPGACWRVTISSAFRS